jgi:hypothetical protein
VFSRAVTLPHGRLQRYTAECDPISYRESTL